jgi:hypothetical protein
MPFGSLWGLSPYSNGDGMLSDAEALDARRAGNLGIGTGLLSAAGPSPYPISVGQALSSALLQGRAMQSNTLDSALKRKLLMSEALKNQAELAHYLQPVAQPGFSLNPGEKRYDAYGRVIAEAPAAPEKPGAPGELAQKVKVLQDNGIRITPDMLLTLAGAVPKPKEEHDLTTAELGQWQLKDGNPLPPFIKTADQARAIGAVIVSPEDRARNRPVSDPQLYRLPDGSAAPPGATPAQLEQAGAAKYTPDEIKQMRLAAEAQKAFAELKTLALGTPAANGAPATAGAFTGNGGGPGNSMLFGNAIARADKLIMNKVGSYLNTDASGTRDAYSSTADSLIGKLLIAAGERASPAMEAHLRAALPSLDKLPGPDTEQRARDMFDTFEKIQLPQAIGSFGNGNIDVTKLTDAQLQALLNGK